MHVGLGACLGLGVCMGVRVGGGVGVGTCSASARRPATAQRRSAGACCARCLHMRLPVKPVAPQTRRSYSRGGAILLGASFGGMQRDEELLAESGKFRNRRGINDGTALLIIGGPDAGTRISN